MHPSTATATWTRTIDVVAKIGPGVPVTTMWVVGDGTHFISNERVQPTALLSQLSVLQDARSMKFNPFSHKNPNASEPQPSPVKQFNLPAQFYDDPAFSPDPRSNPLFAPNHSPEWSLSPPPGHPTLKKRTLPQNHFNDLILIQPPNSPALPDAQDHTAYTRPTQQSQSFITLSNPEAPATVDIHSPPSHPSQLIPSPSSSTSTPPSSEAHVQINDDMPRDVQPPRQHAQPSRQPPQLSQQPPKPSSSSNIEQKKRPGLFSRLLGTSPGVQSGDSSSSTSTISKSSGSNHRSSMRPSQDPPPYEPIARTPLQPAVTHSTPELHRTERPVLAARAKTSRPAVTEREIIPTVVAAAAAGRAVDEWHLRKDLDKIDELDESNPFGVALHLDGPYEAISKIIPKPEPNPQMQYGRATHPQSSSGFSLVLSHDVYANAQLMALKAGSLNLKPGQLLPRDLSSLEHPRRSNAYPQHNPPQQHTRQHQHHQKYPQSDIPNHKSRFPVEAHAPFQMVVSPHQPPLSVIGNYPERGPASVSDSQLTRRRTPSPTAATTHSDEDDAAISLGKALMGGGIPKTNTSDGDSTVVASEADYEHFIPPPVQAEAAPRNAPVENNQQHAWHMDPHPPSIRSDNLRTNATRPRESMMTVGETWNTPPVNVPRDPSQFVPPPHAPSMPTPWHSQPLPPRQEPPPPPQFVPPPPSAPRHASWQPQQAMAQPGQYVRPPRQELRSLQPLPTQPPPQAMNPSDNHYVTYMSDSARQQAARSALVSSLKSGPPSVLRERDADTRSMQPSVATTNASSLSQGGHPYRNRFLPKNLVMPTPLQPSIQNQPQIHQVQFVPQGYNHPQNLSPPRVKAATITPQQLKAQTIPIAPSNKLRKRVSLLGGIKSKSSSKEAPAVAAVTFSANILSADNAPVKAEKSQKRILKRK